MTNLPRRAALLAALACGLLLAAPAAPALDAWMTEEAMRAAFIGKTLDGHYGNGVAWTETYFADGRLDYRESRRRAVGKWHRNAHAGLRARAAVALVGGGRAVGRRARIR